MLVAGKGFLLYEIMQLVPGLSVAGIDISDYAIEHAKEEIKSHLELGTACQLPYADQQFDLVYSLTTLHNLFIYDLEKALQEITRVSKNNGYIVVESYRNEQEKNQSSVLAIDLRMSFILPKSGNGSLRNLVIRGDYSFIFFE